MSREYNSRYPSRRGDERRDGPRNNNNFDSDRSYRPQHNDRQQHNGGDTYRSSSYRDNERNGYHNGRDSRDNRQSYSNYDSRGQSGNSYNHPGPPGVPPPGPPSYPQPPPPDRDSFQPPQGDFSFRVEKPAGVQDSRGDSYRPNGGNQRRGQDNPFPPRQIRDTRRGRGRGSRGGYRGTFQRFKASDRPMLDVTQTGNAIEHSYFDEEAGATYRPLSELSDDDEVDMDISDNEDKGDSSTPQEPSTKRARLNTTNPSAADGDSVPKWSNPDPYTALPPPDAADRQRKDVVQLIRKARIQTKESRHSLPAETEDFIPCFDSSDEEAEDEGEITLASPSVGTGPRSQQSQNSRTEVNTSALDGAQTSQVQNTTSFTSINRPDPATYQPHPLPAKPLQPLAEVQPLPEISATSQTTVISKATELPPKPAPFRPEHSKPSTSKRVTEQKVPVDHDQYRVFNEGGGTLYTRKRTIDDNIKLPDHARLKKVTKMPAHGTFIYEWQIKRGVHDTCPWSIKDHSSESNIGIWLHKEIVDFYEYVKPRDFEAGIRWRLVNELKDLVRQRYGDAEVYPFGSFPSGLYLPTGDVDLAFLSDNVINGRQAKYSSKSFLFRVRQFLKEKRLTSRDDIEVITGAKVPIIKYIDQRTGLRVDISFEKIDGVHAVKTFLAWKKQYPAMPILVTLIKHFLLMRGMNEPVNGGIGGFSVICLVVSMLQLMPQVQSGNMNQEHHLGDLLMHFFDLYGNRFNYETTAIRLNPPGYVAKNQVREFAYKSYDRLSIIDPNNPENDISGGSSNARRIFNLFAEAYALLRQRMAYLHQGSKGQRQNASILEVIFAGDYDTFKSQREFLKKLVDTGLVSLDSLPAEVEPSPW